MGSLTLARARPGRPGDPGLFGPGSAVWRIGRERALLAAGPAALLMQLAHPLVAAGVAAHSGFRSDPFARLRATLDAVLAISFGDRTQAAEARARVQAVHSRVRGRLPRATGAYPRGTPYDASDPALALWVHATLVWAALEGHERLVGPLRGETRARYYEESKRFAAQFGVTGEVVPDTYEEYRAYWASMVDGDALAVGDEARRLAVDVLHPPLPPLVGPAGAALRLVTAGLLPSRFRAAYGLAWGEGERRRFTLLCAASRSCTRVLPPAARHWPHARFAARRVRS